MGKQTPAFCVCVCVCVCEYMHTFLFCLVFGLSRQGFSVALEPVLELALVDQAGLDLTEIHLLLPPKCWD